MDTVPAQKSDRPPKYSAELLTMSRAAATRAMTTTCQKSDQEKDAGGLPVCRNGFMFLGSRLGDLWGINVSPHDREDAPRPANGRAGKSR